MRPLSGITAVAVGSIMLLGGGYLAGRRVAQRAAAVRALEAQAHVTARVDAARVQAAAAVARDSSAVSDARTTYEAARAPLIVRPATPAETLATLQQLPAFVLAADRVVARASQLQASDARYRVYADSTIGSLRTERDGWRSLAEQPLPRRSAALEALYDPITQTPAIAVEGALRVAGRVSAIVRVEQRFAPGERPRGYVGARIGI